MLDEIAGQAEREALLNQRTGVIRLESTGAEKYLKFYRRVLIPASLGSLLIPVLGIFTSLWAEECAGLAGMQMFGGRYKHPARMYLAYALIGRRGIAVSLPALVGIAGGLLVTGAFALGLVSGDEVWAGTELWSAINAGYVIKQYFQATKAARAAQGAADYMQQKQGGN
ncbi:hypothetical protein HF923_01245 [Acidithiobacillus ferriphilus]|uniref:hypothetical protein n=1 Tax=Acidithiobacillus ferriphilus TaxID=1689834 RepID=UPI001C0701D9|nr:hypothetical protein [Acidithiobacillus ferriphilus]MBU2844476.1 hypothetical protein [Acidithiobacillus ferriphilus]